MNTRPRRPRAVPCEATYDVGNRPPASHWATPALRLPVTGSSAIPISGQKARISTAHSLPSGYGPTTPMSMPAAADQSGSRASTSSAESSSTPTQPGPLSIHSRSRTCEGSIRRARTIRSRSSSDTSPDRMNGGPAKASRSPRRSCTRPAPHSCTSVPSVRGTPPASSHACAEPIVG